MSVSAETGRDSLTTSPLDEKDRVLLNVLQDGFPLSSCPYRQVGQRAGMSQHQAYQRVTAMRKRGLIRRIGGVINSEKLGLARTLVAMKVPAHRIDEVASIVNSLPNVTHNYLRDHEYNMWFTLTADSHETLSLIIRRLKHETGISDLLDLPSLATYKIDVRFDFDADTPSTD